jgi:hypothetical protein
LVEVVVEVTGGPENGKCHGDTRKQQATRSRSPETEVIRSNRWLVIKSEGFILVSSELGISNIIGRFRKQHRIQIYFQFL